MKWGNKLHEFDVKAEELISKCCNRFPCYIFGAGMAGKELLPVLKYYHCFAAFIDNNKNKQASGFEGEKVISLDEYKENDFTGIIIVAVSEKNMPIIFHQLKDNGFYEGEDFFSVDDFINHLFPIISVYYYDKSFIPIAQITLTERCSLKCKKCAHACYAVASTAIDLALEDVMQSADIFFSKVDYIKEFVLIGGEPLLYHNMVEVIHYIGERYRQFMSVYCITTNGTIVPSDKLLEVCSKYKVLFRISNYTIQIPRLRNTHQRLITKLKEWNVSYILGEEDWQWRDYGFEYVDKGEEEPILIDTFDQCGTICREIRKNRFYYCVMARSVSENLKFHKGQNDYLDLLALQGKNYKKELLEFSMGYSNKGYLDMCRHCHGSKAFDYPIPVAEQL